MNKAFSSVILLGIVGIIAAGCARTWPYQPIETFKPAEAAPIASTCRDCHQKEFAAWQNNRHSKPERMNRIPVKELHECGACHTGLAAHAQNQSANIPPKISALGKTEQNTVCGKCHYNQQIFKGRAINPHDRHGLYKSVGLEGHKRQIACLDCHSGHQGGTEMLVRAKVHICFKCHRSAIATMGIFQPFNYLSFGKACQACHAVHGGSSGAQWARMGTGVCVICHVVGTAIVD